MSTQESKKQQFAKLTRDIDWQRTGFLRYCLNIAESNASNLNPEESIVRKILEGYLALALLFYKQFRTDLFVQYQQSKREDIIVKIKMQDALERLVNEWQRVYSIIVAIRSRKSNGESKRLVNEMSPFVSVAMTDVDLSYEEFPVILQFGESYSLKFSKYSDNFAALNIPLWILNSPWEWTILWHELAGEKVRALRKEKKHFFETEFDKAIGKLKKKDEEYIRKLGWSVDWFEELFEDSFSVIHFPIHFLFVLENLLERFPDTGRGQRHPPASIRLATAMCLHLQMKGFKKTPKWNLTTWKKWIELKDEKVPDRFSRFDPNTQLADEINIKTVWLVANRIINWHREKKIINNKANDYQRIVSRAVIEYSRKADRVDILDQAIGGIRRVSDLKKSNNIIEEAQGITKTSGSFEIINKLILSDLRETEEEKLFKKLDATFPQVKSLLNGLGYDELLKLSFFERDFFNGLDIKNVQRLIKNSQGKPEWVDIFPTINSTTIVDNLMSSFGDISFEINDKIYKTTLINWNGIFPEGDAYHLS